jgi:hypothetical protein
MIYLTYVFLNTDTCTQGRIDFYSYSAIKLVILSIILICFEFYFFKTIKDKLIFFNIFKVIGICISGIQSLPYIIFTTIRGITICQGSTEWGGFSNKYKFEEIQITENIIERILPICYIMVTLIFILLMFIENKRAGAGDRRQNRSIQAA